MITTDSSAKSSDPTMLSSHSSETPRLRVVPKTPGSRDAHQHPPHPLFNDPVPPPTLTQPSDTNRPPASQMPMPQTADMTPDEIFRTIIDYFTNPFKPSLPYTSGTSTRKPHTSLDNATQQVSLYTATAPLVLFFLFVPLSCALLHTRVSVGQGPRSQKNRILSFTRDMHFWLRGVFGIAGGDGDMITLVDVFLVLGLIVLVLVLWRIIIVLGGYTATWITSRLTEEAEREGEGEGEGEEVYGMGVRGFGKYVMIKDGEKAMEEREKMLMSGAKSFEGVVESGSGSDDDDDEEEEEEEGVQRVNGLTAMSLCL